MSNYAPQPTDMQEKPYEATPQSSGKRSGCFKGCMILGILGVVAVVVCCVGGFFYFRNAVKTDPVAVRQVASELADSQFNEDMTPVMGMATFFMDMAIFQGEEGNLLLLVHSPYMNMNDRDKLDAQFRQSMNRNDGNEVEKTKVIEDGEETITVKGEEVTFDFNHTQGVDSGAEYWEVIGVISADKGATIVFLRANHDSYTRDEVIERLRAIK